MKEGFVIELLWFLTHMRPRWEKKLAGYFEKTVLSAIVPCFKAVYKYRRKAVVFPQAAFPWVGFHRRANWPPSNLPIDYLANLLRVFLMKPWSIT
jgi:hypothetical protein